MTLPNKRPGPQRITRCLLVLFLVGICSRGYGYYNQTLKTSPQVWMDVARGTASAPEQYRVGVVTAAYWVTQHMVWHGHGLRLSQVFGIFDLLGSIVAVLTLYQLLEGTDIYKQSSSALQWFGSASFAALTIYAIDWTDWYQKVGTLPTAGLTALMAWLWSPHGEPSAKKSAWTAIGVLLLVVLQSFIRADIALMLCLGVLVASELGLSSQLSMPRGAAMATSALGILVAASVQVYLTKVRYPQASYGDVPVFMLRHDYWRLNLWATCLIFLAPVLWTTAQVARRRQWGEGAGGALLLGALGYAALWITMGRLDEVRIFLPMALVTIPLTVETMMRRAGQNSVSVNTQE